MAVYARSCNAPWWRSDARPNSASGPSRHRPSGRDARVRHRRDRDDPAHARACATHRRRGDQRGGGRGTTHAADRARAGAAAVRGGARPGAQARHRRGGRGAQDHPTTRGSALSRRSSRSKRRVTRCGADQGILERHLDEQRLRLRSSIGELQRLLDDPAGFGRVTQPELSGVTLPEFVEEPAASTLDDAAVVEAPSAPVDDAGVIDLSARPTRPQPPEILRPPRTGSVTFSPPDDSEGPSTGTREPRTADVSPSPTTSTTTPGCGSRRASSTGPDDGGPRQRRPWRRRISHRTAQGHARRHECVDAHPGEERARPRFGRRRGRAHTFRFDPPMGWGCLGCSGELLSV